MTPGGLHRENAYLTDEERQALRKFAFDNEMSKSMVIRIALCRLLGIEEPDPYA
ncbi:MAG: hypothetical protein AAF604_04615 [Acidobacteriota bacterium]